MSGWSREDEVDHLESMLERAWAAQQVAEYECAEKVARIKELEADAAKGGALFRALREAERVEYEIRMDLGVEFQPGEKLPKRLAQARLKTSTARLELNHWLYYLAHPPNEAEEVSDDDTSVLGA